MKGQKQLHSSGSDEYGTPQLLFDYLDEKFNFALDVAATHDNSKCGRYFTEEDDSLQLAWGYASYGDAVWCNPPYSIVSEFMSKAAEESPYCSSVVFLVPARTDTLWFHKALENCTSVYLIKGRLKFESKETIQGAPFPSCLIIWGKDMLVPVEPIMIPRILPLELSTDIRGFNNKEKL